MSTVLQNTRALAKTSLRSLLQRCGCGYLSSVGLDQLDLDIVEILEHKRHGVFIEAGANDGISQSNTYYLEKVLGWTGVLIEPLPELAQKCEQLRTAATVINRALVREGYPQDEVCIERANLMSTVNDGVLSSDQVRHHLDRGRQLQGLEELPPAMVPTATLASVLAQLHIAHVDFFSLDVEGYEMEVLAGLDLNATFIERILVETRPENSQQITAHLRSHGYYEERQWQYPTYTNVLFHKPFAEA